MKTVIPQDLQTGASLLTREGYASPGAGWVCLRAPRVNTCQPGLYVFNEDEHTRQDRVMGWKHLNWNDPVKAAQPPPPECPTFSQMTWAALNRWRESQE